MAAAAARLSPDDPVFLCRLDSVSKAYVPLSAAALEAVMTKKKSPAVPVVPATVAGVRGGMKMMTRLPWNKTRWSDLAAEKQALVQKLYESFRDHHASNDLSRYSFNFDTFFSALLSGVKVSKLDAMTRSLTPELRQQLLSFLSQQISTFLTSS